MKKKLGLRYCGGCRAQYDRVAAAEKIMEGLEAHGVQMESVDDFSETGTGLLVCGCPVQCAGREENFFRGWHILGPENLFDRKKEDLETILETLCRDAGKDFCNKKTP